MPSQALPNELNLSDSEFLRSQHGCNQHVWTGLFNLWRWAWSRISGLRNLAMLYKCQPDKASHLLVLSWWPEAKIERVHRAQLWLSCSPDFHVALYEAVLISSLTCFLSASVCRSLCAEPHFSTCLRQQMCLCNLRSDFKTSCCSYANIFIAVAVCSLV